MENLVQDVQEKTDRLTSTSIIFGVLSTQKVYLRHF